MGKEEGMDYLYRDPNFPAENSSLAYSADRHSQAQDVKWTRPSVWFDDSLTCSLFSTPGINHCFIRFMPYSNLVL